MAERSSVLDFSYLLSRLGITKTESPQVEYQAQISLHAGDISQLVPPILGPGGVFGAQIAAAVGGYPIQFVTSAVPVLVKAIISSSAAQDVHFRGRTVGWTQHPVPSWITGPFANDTSAFYGTNFTGNPCPPAVATWEFGTSSGPPFFIHPTVHLGAGQAAVLPDLWVPAGGYLWISGSTANVPLNIAGVFYEYPAPNEQPYS